MRDAVCAAIAAVLLFAAAAPRLGRRLPPTWATLLLVPASLAMAGSTVFVLGALAATWLGQSPAIAALGEWSSARLDATDPVPDPLAAASLVLLAATAGWATYRITRRVRAMISMYRTCRELHASGPVVVLEDDRPDAFATPAGGIVVTAALWHALTKDERRVVLAHERSHVAHRHTWWTFAADLAAAINPLLRPTASAVAHAVERWADEDAAREVGDRNAAARTIARTALLRHGAAKNALVPAATGGDVPQRVRALLAPPPRRNLIALAALAALLLAGAVATLAVERTSDALFDHAALGDSVGIHSHHDGHEPH
ncbi:MAG TPA: M56 family metallopeptidase [Pseudonocardiaceae bacterium]|jgi:beta-lactamase regulating signal transducer with metallopeptidase domain|nr:M56 family metallopeptidase [Pseudonocardiaceae bacterium]